MELLDFNYWTNIVESAANEQVNKVFTIGPDFKTLVTDTYYKVADSVLSEFTNGFEYELHVNPSNLSIKIVFGDDDDDIRSSIYGVAESFSIVLKSLIYVEGFYGIGSHLLSSTNLPKLLQVQFRNEIIDKSNDTTTIRVSAGPNEFELKLNNIAKIIGAGSNAWSSADTDYTAPTIAEYLAAVRPKEEADKEEAIKILANKLNNSIRYQTALEVFKIIVSDLNLNIDELASQISEKTNSFKAIDLDKLPEDEKKATLTEILKFQNYLLSLSNPRKIQESKIAVDSLIDIFRILIKQFGDLKTVKKELALLVV